MNASAAPFEAPDQLAPYVAKIRDHLNQHPGLTVIEVQKTTKLGENVVRAALDRLSFLKLVHCTLRTNARKRGSPPREYRPGPCPILVN